MVAAAIAIISHHLVLVRTLRPLPLPAPFSSLQLVLVRPQPHGGRSNGHDPVLRLLRRVLLHEGEHVEVAALRGGLVLKETQRMYACILDLSKMFVFSVVMVNEGDVCVRIQAILCFYVRLLMEGTHHVALHGAVLLQQQRKITVITGEDKSCQCH